MRLFSCCFESFFIRLKEKNSMSQSLWQIGRPDPNCVFFNMFFFEQQTCQIWVGHNFVQYEIWNLIYMDEQDTRQNTELKKSFVQSVLLCLSCRFMYILTSKFIKNWKNLSKQKKFKTWILLNQTSTEKQKCAAALRHTIFFFCLIRLVFQI